MLLQGILSLRRETTGTVALVTAGNAVVLAVAAAAPNGRFALQWSPLPPGSILYGFPGQTLTAGEISDALAEPSALVYEAIVPPVPTERLIFVNAISTCISAVLRRDFALGAMPASAAT